MLAIVLSRRDFREFDQIISLYTKEKGKLEALARGVKKITSKNSGSLEPFCLVEIEIVPGKEIKHITTVQPVLFLSKIHDDLKKMVLARQVLEIVNSLVPIEEENQALFNLLEDWLVFVNDAPNMNSFVVSAFMVKLLACLGFTPELNVCLRCGKLVEAPQKKFYFVIARGGIIHEACFAPAFIQADACVVLSYKDMDLLRILSSSSFSDINMIGVSFEQKSMVDSLIYNFTLYHTGKKLTDWRIVNNFFW